MSLICGRGDRIRTCDILLPKQARYQTAPLPDGLLPLGEARIPMQALSFGAAEIGNER